MRISDWSSDVCASDLCRPARLPLMLCIQKAPTQVGDVLQQHDIDRCRVLGAIKNSPAAAVQGVVLELIANPFERRARLRQGVAPAAAGEFDSSVVGAQQTRPNGNESCRERVSQSGKI